LRQPTVSAHIQDLEKGIGGKLFYRTPGKVSLTPLGEMIAIKASSLLAFKRETLSAVEQFHGTLSGELWIGGSNIPGEYLLPQKLGAFIQKYPEVRPILRISDSAGVIEDVVDGKVEVGYVGFKAVDARLAFETIWKDEMVLAIPKNHHWAARRAIELSALQSERFISRETGSGTLDSFRELLAGRGEAADKVLNVAMQLGSTEAVKQALLAGFGVSILSRTSIRRELAEGVLIEVPIEGFKMERDFYEVIYRQRPLSPAAQAFRQFLQLP